MSDPQPNSGTDVARAELVPTARLFGQLLVRELDADQLEELSSSDVATALASVGIELPAHEDLETLRADYFAHFLHPETGAPPIASLWTEGQYEGPHAAALRRIAAAAGYELDRDAAAGAAIDHLGCILLLWAACAETDPELADLIASEHLDWVERALTQTAAGDGFYPALCRATVELTQVIRISGTGQ